MVTLRIQELAEAKGLTLEKLSEASGVSVGNIHKYAGESIQIQEDSAADIQRIAKTLEISSVELVKPQMNAGFVRLNIIPILQDKNQTLEELSEASGIHLSVLAFYSTQPLCREKIAESQVKERLQKIADFLECSMDELLVETVDIPVIRYDIDAAIEVTNLSQKEFSVLTNISEETLDLIRSQRINNFLNLPKGIYTDSLKEIWCEYLGEKVSIIECENAKKRQI